MFELLNNLRLRVKALLRRRQFDRDLEDELALHMALREEKLSSEVAVDARAAAHRRFGNLTRIKEDCRELWSFVTIERLWDDVRLGLRLILKNRGAMLAVVLSLSLGIGSTAAVFTIFDNVLIRPLDVPETERVVRVASTAKGPTGATGLFGVLISNADFEDLRIRAQSFHGMATYSPGQLPQIAAHAGQTPWTAYAVLVSSEFFSRHLFDPVAGRGFLPDEDRDPGRDAVAVISYGLWQREYGGTRDLAGQTIRINSKEFSIVGVAPPAVDEMNAYGSPEVYLPRVMETVFGNGPSLSDRQSRRLQLFARLKPGIELEQSRDEVSRVATGRRTS